MPLLRQALARGLNPAGALPNAPRAALGRFLVPVRVRNADKRNAIFQVADTQMV